MFKYAKRIFLFLAINFIVVMTISLILSIFNIRPYLTAYGLDLKSLLIFCFIWGMGGAFISLLLSKTMSKWMLGVKIIPENTNDPALRKLLHMVEDLSRKAALKGVPEVGIYSSKEPNAFATGPSERRSLVAVSTGLLEKMSEDELEAILGHEISHISNGDMITMTLLQGVVNAFVMFLARALAYVVSGLGRSRSENSGGGSYFSYIMFVFLFEFVFMIFGSMIVAGFSRYREFRADRGGAFLAGKEKMISALRELQHCYEKKEVHVKPSMQALMIQGSRKPGRLISLFATHPPLEKRIARLQETI